MKSIYPSNMGSVHKKEIAQHIEIEKRKKETEQ
jgi:hypothetical protein